MIKRKVRLNLRDQQRKLIFYHSYEVKHKHRIPRTVVVLYSIIKNTHSAFDIEDSRFTLAPRHH